MRQHKDSAISAFEGAAYFAAIYDSAFVIGYDKAAKKMQALSEKADIAGNTDAIIAALNLRQNQKFQALWSELYYAQSQYSFQQFNQTQTPEYLLSSIKLQGLCEELEKAFLSITFGASYALPEEKNETEIASQIEMPNQATEENGKIEPQIQLNITPSVQKNVLRDTLLFAAGAILVAVIIYLLLARPQKKKMTKSPKEKLEALEDLLLEGKIGEPTFVHLQKKYEAQVKMEKKEKSKKRKRI
jgi:hypothetical protein